MDESVNNVEDLINRHSPMVDGDGNNTAHILVIFTCCTKVLVFRFTISRLDNSALAVFRKPNKFGRRWNFASCESSCHPHFSGLALTCIASHPFLKPSRLTVPLQQSGRLILFIAEQHLSYLPLSCLHPQTNKFLRLSASRMLPSQE